MPKKKVNVEAQLQRVDRVLADCYARRIDPLKALQQACTSYDKRRSRRRGSKLRGSTS